MRTFTSPRNRLQAEASISSGQRRIEQALAPYLARAENFHARDMAKPDIRERLAARNGVEPDDLEDIIDGDRSIVAAAIVELLVDLQHHCYADSIPLNSCYHDAESVFGMQVREAAKFIIYGRPDQPAEVE